MSFSKNNPEHIDVVISTILDRYAGTVVHNAELKAFLCTELPEMFPTGRADGAVEFLASVAFRSTVSKTGIGGVAFLEGIKEGSKRYWKVPLTTDNVVAKADIVNQLQEPLPTRKIKLSFGEYVAAKKQGNEA